MEKPLYRLAQGVGLLLLLVTLSSSLIPAKSGSAPEPSLALRQIGHDYLSACGDPTSRIPPVREMDDGRLVLPLEQTVDYDAISLLAQSVLADYGVKQNYTLSLEDCTSGEVFLGSLWNADPNVATMSGPACIGRDQEDRCANVGLLIHTEAEQSVHLGSWLLGGLGILLLVVGTIYNGKLPDTPGEAPISTPTSDAAATKVARTLHLSQHSTFDEANQQLSVMGENFQLTHREGQLLAYLAARPNLVLPRQDIHDAVWGVDGIITGRSLDVFISRLRKKLKGDEGLEIRTVHGVGYRFSVG